MRFKHSQLYTLDRMYLHCIVLPLESDVDFDLQLDDGAACTCSKLYLMAAEKMSDAVQQISYGKWCTAGLRKFLGNCRIT